MGYKIKVPLEFYEIGTILFVNYPFEDFDKSKRRPALLIANSKERMLLLLLKMTSKGIRNTTYDYKLQDLADTGLQGQSVVRCNKGYYFSYNLEYEYAGHLDSNDLKEVLLRYYKAVKNKNFEVIKK